MPLASVAQAVEGSYEIKLGDGESFNTGKGGFFIAPSGVQQTIVHHVDEESGKMNARWIFFDVAINDTLKFDDIYKFPTVISDAIVKQNLNECFDRMFENKGLLEDKACCYRILSILSEIGEHKNPPAKNPVYSAVDLIEKNYSYELSVADLAKAACTSQSNLYALFRKNYGISPIAYLNRYRLSVAAQMLEETDLSVSSVGAKTGINDPLYFSKIFKTAYGISPRDYRKMLKNR